MSKYYRGFIPVTCIGYDAVVHMPAAAVNIKKGQIIFDDGSGYATNVGTAFANTFRGVAAVDVDNSAGAAGAVNVPVIRPLPMITWRVPNLSTTKIAQTDVGELCDLEADPTNTASAQGIDVTDNTIATGAGAAFVPDEIDVSQDALDNDGVVSTGGGFCLGRFVVAVT